MENWLNAIVAAIASGRLVSAPYLHSLDCDIISDARQKDKKFVAEWIRIFKEAERRWAEAKIPDEERRLAEDIRRESFMAVSRATRQHEIASYVSDDLDLIVRGKLLAMNDELLDQLWAVYERGEFPYPPFTELGP